MRNQGKRIVFAAIGSLGDLYPCLALAKELQARGYLVTIASTEFYRKQVEDERVAFHPIRPNWNPTDQELIRQCEDLRTGPEILYRRLILPHLRDTYKDLVCACADADLMIAGELVYAAPLVAEKLGLKWISSILSPSSFFSSHDPSLLVTVPELLHLHKAGRWTYRAGLNICRLATRHWSNPVRHLRRELGLRRDCDPVFRDKFSPELVMALFSRWLAQPQPDWPAQTIQPGFIYYEHANGDAKLSSALAEFLAKGNPPIVFTLGSTAVHHPGDFYESSMRAAAALGRRAILVGGNETFGLITRDILGLPYAPYSQVFPHAAVVVHQGGSGTTAQAMRAGRPMLFVPYGWDQPDNAMRAVKLGLGLCLTRKSYSSANAAHAINRLLTEPQFAARAAEIAGRLRDEDALTQACDAIEMILRKIAVGDHPENALALGNRSPYG